MILLAREIVDAVVMAKVYGAGQPSERVHSIQTCMDTQSVQPFTEINGRKLKVVHD